MKRNLLAMSLAVGLIATGMMLPRLQSADAPKKSDFASTTIDFGMLVSDADKSVKFYTEAVGFKEIKGFDVPPELGRDSGLTANKPFKVRILVLEDAPTATKVKIIEMPGSNSKKSDNEFVESQLGVRYLTIFVNDTTAAMERLTKAGVKPIAKGPVALPKGFPEGVFLTVLRDPDGHLVELVGPKAVKK